MAPTGRYNLEQIAAVAFFANKGMRLALGNVEEAWRDEHELTRESYRAGVLFVTTHHPTPLILHNAWMRWNRENRPGDWVHDNMVAWPMLPLRERDKDVIFLRIVETLAAA